MKAAIGKRARAAYVGHYAVRGVVPGDPRVIYACGDSLAYHGAHGMDTTNRGQLATSHDFEAGAARPKFRCEDCEAASIEAARWKR